MRKTVICPWDHHELSLFNMTGIIYLNTVRSQATKPGSVRVRMYNVYHAGCRPSSHVCIVEKRKHIKHTATSINIRSLPLLSEQILLPLGLMCYVLIYANNKVVQVFKRCLFNENLLMERTNIFGSARCCWTYVPKYRGHRQKLPASIRCMYIIIIYEPYSTILTFALRYRCVSILNSRMIDREPTRKIMYECMTWPPPAK